MGRYTGPSCKKCRKALEKLFLKGTKCQTPKCPVEKRRAPYRRGRPSAYAVHLRETQKVRQYYGVRARQFKRVFFEAERLKGNSGENVFILLERRVDNVIRRSGFSLSQKQARQIVRHKHVTVNGKRVDIPSYLIKPGDVVKISGDESLVNMIQGNLKLTESATVPSWIECNPAQLEATIVAVPTRGEVPIEVQEHLIVEFSSR